MRGLYPIVDVDALAGANCEVVPFATRLLEARPALLQLRAKNASARETLGWLEALVPLCRAQGTLLFANDRPDLAVLAGCDGVHLGQEDLPPRELRRFAPELKLGISTHDIPQLRAALAERPDYVAFGPLFATRSKQRPDAVVGLDGLAAASVIARAHGCPLVAIGGITLQRAAEVGRYAQLAAVIAALLPPSGDPKEVASLARKFQDALGGA